MRSRTDTIKKNLHVTLTRTCNYNCSWCNQRYDIDKPVYTMSDSGRKIVDNKLRTGAEWISGLNAFPYKSDYRRLIFSGGEPSVHPDFFSIVAKVKGYNEVLLTTNLSFDVEKLIQTCLENDSQIVVQPSFQFEYTDFDVFLEKMELLAKHSMLSKSIPASIVDLPDRPEPHEFKEKFAKHGYNVPLYEFEGYYKGRFDYANIEGFGSQTKTYKVVCCSSTNCVKPNGDIVFCPTDEYFTEAYTYGNICDRDYRPIGLKRTCNSYGKCHISSASWIEVESPDTGKVIWRGKNFPIRSISGKIIQVSKKHVRRVMWRMKTASK